MFYLEDEKSDNFYINLTTKLIPFIISSIKQRNAHHKLKFIFKTFCRTNLLFYKSSANLYLLQVIGILT